jgi:SAM-dependent methyltransferase
MKAPASHDLPSELKAIYAERFSGTEAYRTKIWQILTSRFFSRWVKPSDTVLDLGSGYGEFINNVQAAKKYAMDLNPEARLRITPAIEFLEQDCSRPWALPDNALDVVFTSNFFEHLPDKRSLQLTVVEAYRCLKPGGRLIALGPNVKFLSGQYWDFFDHHVPLTDLSLAELLRMSGYKIEWVTARFLPYTMSQGFQPPTWMLSAYLKTPVLWRLFGRQFLVVARKPA